MHCEIQPIAVVNNLLTKQKTGTQNAATIQEFTFNDSGHTLFPSGLHTEPN